MIIAPVFQAVKNRFNPVASLYGTGDEGAFFEAKPQYLYTDAARSNLIADPGDPVGGITDLSGNGAHGSQSSDPDRVVYGVVPRGGRRNLLTYTEDLSNINSVSTTSIEGISWEDVQVEPPAGSNRVQRVTPDAGSSRKRIRLTQYPSGDHTMKVRIKPDGIRYVNIGYSSAARNAAFDLLTLDVIQQSVDVAGPSGINELPGGWLEIYYPRNSQDLFFYVVDDLAQEGIGHQATTDGNDSFLLAGIQVVEGAEDLPYQRVRSQYEVTEAGVQSVHTLNFNLTNQYYNATLPAGTYTVAIAGINGIWFDEVTHAGGTFSVGPTTYTGGPDGILEVVGPLVAFPAVEPVISEAKKARLVQYFKALGSPGTFELGANLADEWLDGAAIWSESAESLYRSNGVSGGILETELLGDYSGTALVYKTASIEPGEVYVAEITQPEPNEPTVQESYGLNVRQNSSGAGTPIKTLMEIGGGSGIAAFSSGELTEVRVGVGVENVAAGAVGNKYYISAVSLRKLELVP